MFNRLFVVFLLALAFAAGSTPVTRVVAHRAGLVDRPGGRKLQKVPIPVLGGLAIILAVLFALIALGDTFSGDAELVRQLAGIMSGGLLLAFMGFVDDHRPLSAYLKLGVQLAAALILVWSGLSVQLFRSWPADVAITVIWVVGITNAINFLDNMDGLSSGVVAIAAAFFALLGLLQAPPQVLVGGLAAALAGGSLGFWYHNFYRGPATIYMGDVGTLFLGFMLAVLGIKLRFPSNTYVITWMIPVFVLGLPIFDTTLVFISRLRRGLNPLTTPGLDHLSHRLVERGLTRREAVLSIYLVCGALGMIAVALTRATLTEAYPVAGTVLAIGAYMLWRLEWRRVPPEQTRI